jgi:hypothetical protein
LNSALSILFRLLLLCLAATVGFRISATESLGGSILDTPAATISRAFGYDPL